jgi:hypothetical protein
MVSNKRISAQQDNQDNLVERFEFQERADRSPLAGRGELALDPLHDLLLQRGGGLGSQRPKVAMPDPGQKYAFFGQDTIIFVDVQK